MLPSSIITNFINLIYTILLLSIDGYLLYRWYDEGGTDQAMPYLIWSIALTVISLFGWVIFPILFGGKNGETIPGEQERLNSDDKTLFVESYGKTDKPTLIFTNGWSTTAQVWHYFRKDLTQDYNLVFWDEPGLGKSLLPEDNDYSLTKYADDLKKIVDSAPNSQIILVGHSIGGMIIQVLFKLYPEQMNKRITGLVLMNTTYINPIHTSITSKLLGAIQYVILKPLIYIQIYTWPIWQFNNWLSFLNGSLHISSFVSGFSGKQTKQELNLTAKFMATSRVDVVNKGNLGMMKLDTRDSLKTISVPALVISGSKDIMTQAKAGEFIAAQIPKSQLNLIFGANHMGLLEYHEEYLSVLRDWLKKVV